MFEKFTERARKAVALARQEAMRLGSEYIAPEHVLLGILQLGEGVGAGALQRLRIDPPAVRRELEKLSGPPASSPAPALGQLPFSPDVRRLLDLARESCDIMGQEMIGTQNLLLGILQLKQGVAPRALANLGLDVDAMARTVAEILAEGSSQGPPLPSGEAPTLVETNLFHRALAYRALADRPALQDTVARLLQQGRSVALVGPKHVGKTSLVLALARAKAGTFTYWSIDYRIFDESHGSRRSMPKRSGAVCFVPEGELVAASRSLVADLLDERRRAGERLILEFRDGGFEEYSKRHPDLAREFETVAIAPPDAEERRRLLESAKPRLRETTGIGIDDDVLAQTDRLARERWPRLVSPWPTLITLWKAAAIQNESASRGDLQRLEQDIAELESSGKTQEAELLKRHADGLRGVGQSLSVESIRQAVAELADKPSAHF